MILWKKETNLSITPRSSKVKLVWSFRFSLFVFRYSNWVEKSYFDFPNPIFTFEMSRKIVFWHLKSYLTFALSRKILFWYSKSYVDIRTVSETFFWHSKSYFDIRGKSYFDIKNTILTFEMSRKILFWYSKSYFDIRTESENPILIFKILFWHSN